MNKPIKQTVLATVNTPEFNLLLGTYAAASVDSYTNAHAELVAHIDAYTAAVAAKAALDKDGNHVDDLRAWLDEARDDNEKLNVAFLECSTKLKVLQEASAPQQHAQAPFTGTGPVRHCVNAGDMVGQQHAQAALSDEQMNKLALDVWEKYSSNSEEYTFKVLRNFASAILAASQQPAAAPAAPAVQVQDDELLPCPFCAASPLMQEHEPHSHSIGLGLPDHPGSFTIKCTTEGCCGMIASTRAEVVAAWNRRAALASQASKGAGVPEAAQQNGGLVRAALVDLLHPALELAASAGTGSFQTQSDFTVRFARGRQALAATAAQAQPVADAAPVEANPIMYAALNMQGVIVYSHTSRENVEMNAHYIKTPLRVVGLVVQPDAKGGA